MTKRGFGTSEGMIFNANGRPYKMHGRTMVPCPECVEAYDPEQDSDPPFLEFLRKAMPNSQLQCPKCGTQVAMNTLAIKLPKEEEPEDVVE